jgi:hypothetical protein
VILFTVVHCTHPSHMDSSPNNPFSIKWDKTKATTETIKCMLGINCATKHEIVSPILSKFEIGNRHSSLSHSDAQDRCPHRQQCSKLFRIVHECVPMYLVASTCCNMGYSPCRPSSAVQDEASFQQAIWHFIAVHATDKDHHELLDYICSVAKPRKMDVQMYKAIYVN